MRIEPPPPKKNTLYFNYSRENVYLSTRVYLHMSPIFGGLPLRLSTFAWCVLPWLNVEVVYHCKNIIRKYKNFTILKYDNYKLALLTWKFQYKNVRRQFCPEKFFGINLQAKILKIFLQIKNDYWSL